MNTDHEWARHLIQEASDRLAASPARDKALETLVGMIDQKNTHESQDDFGFPTLCFYFPYVEPSDHQMTALQTTLLAAGWTRVHSDMDIARPIKFERRMPARQP